MNQLRLTLAMISVLAFVPAGAFAQDDAGAPPQEQLQPSPEQHERVCDDRQDDDGDGLPDCADSDCFEAANCHAGGGDERTNRTCGDWIDNDGDGAVDCEDQDCQTPLVTVCNGSWSGGQSSSGSTGSGLAAPAQVPDLAPGQSIEDLVGHNGDIAGERSDETCSDGLDNDLDGQIDCADISCRFDPMVSVCAGPSGFRLSIGAQVGPSTQWNYNHPLAGGDETYTNESLFRFSAIQFRALGPIPFIQNSFFLLSMRLEDSVRLTFALFQVPLSPLGHYLQVNASQGNLSTTRIISTLYQAFFDAPAYLTNRFEQGNGGSIEVGGPVDDHGILRLRAFTAGGSGQFNGSVGGGFFRADERNFSWNAGGQAQLNIAGQFNRLDNMFMYTPDPGTFAVFLGGKYEQRPAERFFAAHGQVVMRYSHFMLWAESYTGLVMDDPAAIPIQTSFYVMAGVLLVPRLLFLAADVGGYYQPVPYSTGVPTDPTYTSQREETQWRVSLTWYIFRSTAFLTAVYREAYFHYPSDGTRQNEIERQLRLEMRFRY